MKRKSETGFSINLNDQPLTEVDCTDCNLQIALSVPCNSPCLLVSTYAEIVALDYNNATIYPIISNLSNTVAIDVYFSLGYIFWSEYWTQTIKRANIDGTNITILHEYINCGGLAVEWTSSQLYWTSTSRGTISVSDLEGNSKRILFSSSIGTPRGIVLDPFDWLMFWMDERSPRKIWRATLSGTQAVPIVTSNLQKPSGIDLDRQSRLVFWVDEVFNRVESVDYYGNNRKLLFQAQQAWPSFSFYDVTFLSSYLYVSDQRSKKIYKFNATSANESAVSNVSFSQEIYRLVAYDSSRQLPDFSAPCNPPCLLVSTATGITGLDYNNATIYPIVSNSTSSFALDVHFSLGYIFWSDSSGNIKRANIDGSNMTTLHKYTWCGGLAVEWTSSELYWTELNNTISVSDLDGNNRRILVYRFSYLYQITGIVLDPYHGSMFLTYTGSTPKIVRATLSGPEAVSIVTSNLHTPFVIDLDRQSRLVFWVDGALGRVESVDYYGNNRKLLFQFHQRPWPGYYYYGVTFLSPFLFVSDRATDGIYKFNATSANGTVVSNVSISQEINRLVAYDSSRQLPGVEMADADTHWTAIVLKVDSCTSSPCYNNGSCTWLPGGFNCTCLPEFYGDNCETFDNCTSSPCLNNGTCTRYPGGYNCTCRQDFYGDNCENITSTAIATTRTTRTEGSKQKSAIIAGACVGGVLFVVINSFGLVYAYKNRDRFFNRSSKKLTDDPKSYNNDAYVATASNITSGEQATDVENFEFYAL
ncbi:hypothetical protein ACROYT_G033967 [Oculina patagonica]